MTMLTKNRPLQTAFSLFLILLFTSFENAGAERHAPVTAPSISVSHESVSGFDIVLLMDSSGSMKRTDPNNYRKDAARLFIALLGREDRIGVTSFGDQATLLMPPVLNITENQGKLISAVDKISSREFSTNITDAVQSGFDQLKQTRNRNRILLLMSDGKLALGSPEKDVSALAELTKLLPELAKAGIRLYTVAFTEESDSALLENMARVTGGFFRFARTDTDVHVMFTSIFEKIKSPDTIPLEGEMFMIDREIQEAIVLVTKKPGTAISLMDPAMKKHAAGRHSDNLQWSASRVFDMITIKNPAAGKWRVDLISNEGNRVFVITNLRLKSSFDKGFVVTGETITIDAWLENPGGIITDDKLLENTLFSAEITSPDKKSAKLDLVVARGGETRPSGIYSATFSPSMIGEYIVRILAAGKTFTRERSIPFKVVEPTPPADLIVSEQSVTPPSAPVSEEPRSSGEVSWGDVLAKLVLINLSLVILAFVVYAIRKLSGKIRTKKWRNKS